MIAYINNSQHSFQTEVPNGVNRKYCATCARKIFQSDIMLQQLKSNRMTDVQKSLTRAHYLCGMTNKDV